MGSNRTAEIGSFSNSLKIKTELKPINKTKIT
jgi:hypothetical protein